MRISPFTAFTWQRKTFGCPVKVLETFTIPSPECNSFFIVGSIAFLLHFRQKEPGFSRPLRVWEGNIFTAHRVLGFLLRTARNVGGLGWETTQRAAVTGSFSFALFQAEKPLSPLPRCEVPNFIIILYVTADDLIRLSLRILQIRSTFFFFCNILSPHSGRGEFGTDFFPNT